MKKILYAFILLLVFVGNVKAFDIDISKVKINSKSEELINNLDSKFYIDTGKFNNKIIKDNIAVNLASKIVDISFKDKSVKDIKKDLNKYIYISDTDGFETLSGVMFVDLYLNKMSLLRNSVQLKEIHIEIYPENPFASSSCFMLMLRTSEKNATISVEGDRIVFKKNDMYATHFVNVLSSKITECFTKASTGYYEFILNVQNMYYKITN